VDGIDKEFGDRLIVIRANIQDEEAKKLASKYNFQYTPTFIFFDSTGIEVWRSIGSLNPDRVRASLP